MGHPFFKTRKRRNQVYLLLAVAVFLAILFGVQIPSESPQVAKTLAVGVLMAFLWITEAIPLAATALLPIVLFPAFGIMPGKEVAPIYLNSIMFLFIGGFIIALAMERWNLHKRIALRVILSIGQSPARLMLGFMGGSWILSMWISNTATTMMMVPILVALLSKLEQGGVTNHRRFQVGLLLGIAYAASIGGMATLVGTAPNLSLARIFSISFPDAPEITFLKWMALGLPVSFCLFVAAYFFLKFYFTRNIELKMDPEILRNEHRSLGALSFEEKVILAVFASFAVLLVTRADVEIGGTVLHGWSSLFGDPSFIDDGTVAIAVALLLFIVPSKANDEFLMDWKEITKLPWDILILLGGGFALAKGFQSSGLSGYLGSKLVIFQDLHPILLVLVIATMLTFLTELTSNTASTQVVLPIIASLSTVIGEHPLLLMVPATIAASCAFMLPVATPPNAIVFGTHRLTVPDMAKAGIYLNFIAILIVTVLVYVVGRVVYGIDIGAPPDWVK